MTVVSEGPVAAVEYDSQKRSHGEEIQGICPPDALHRAAIDVSPLNIAPPQEEKPQVLREFTPAEIQSSRHPFRLERGNGESSPAKRLLSEGDKCAAYAA